MPRVGPTPVPATVYNKCLEARIPRAAACKARVTHGVGVRVTVVGWTSVLVPAPYKATGTDDAARHNQMPLEIVCFVLFLRCALDLSGRACRKATLPQWLPRDGAPPCF